MDSCPECSDGKEVEFEPHFGCTIQVASLHRDGQGKQLTGDQGDNSKSGKAYQYHDNETGIASSDNKMKALENNPYLDHNDSGYMTDFNGPGEKEELKLEFSNSVQKVHTEQDDSCGGQKGDGSSICVTCEFDDRMVEDEVEHAFSFENKKTHNRIGFDVGVSANERHQEVYKNDNINEESDVNNFICIGKSKTCFRTLFDCIWKSFCLLPRLICMDGDAALNDGPTSASSEFTQGINSEHRHKILVQRDIQVQSQNEVFSESNTLGTLTMDMRSPAFTVSANMPCQPGISMAHTSGQVTLRSLDQVSGREARSASQSDELMMVVVSGENAVEKNPAKTSSAEEILCLKQVPEKSETIYLKHQQKRDIKSKINQDELNCKMNWNTSKNWDKICDLDNWKRYIINIILVYVVALEPRENGGSNLVTETSLPPTDYHSVDRQVDGQNVLAAASQTVDGHPNGRDSPNNSSQEPQRGMDERINDPLNSPAIQCNDRDIGFTDVHLASGRVTEEDSGPTQPSAPVHESDFNISMEPLRVSDVSGMTSLPQVRSQHSSGDTSCRDEGDDNGFQTHAGRHASDLSQLPVTEQSADGNLFHIAAARSTQNEQPSEVNRINNTQTSPVNSHGESGDRGSIKLQATRSTDPGNRSTTEQTYTVRVPARTSNEDDNSANAVEMASMNLASGGIRITKEAASKNATGKDSSNNGQNSADGRNKDMNNEAAIEHEPDMNPNIFAEVIRQHQELYDRTICRICLDRKRSVIFRPCGHFGTCTWCSDFFEKCPFCRSLIVEKKQIVDENEELFDQSLDMARSLSDVELQNVVDTKGSRKRQHANKRASVAEDSGDHSTDPFDEKGKEIIDLVSKQNIDVEGEISVNIDGEVVNSECAHIVEGIPTEKNEDKTDIETGHTRPVEKLICSDMESGVKVNDNKEEDPSLNNEEYGGVKRAELTSFEHMDFEDHNEGSEEYQLVAVVEQYSRNRILWMHSQLEVKCHWLTGQYVTTTRLSVLMIGIEYLGSSFKYVILLDVPCELMPNFQQRELKRHSFQEAVTQNSGILVQESSNQPLSDTIYHAASQVSGLPNSATADHVSDEEVRIDDHVARGSGTDTYAASLVGYMADPQILDQSTFEMRVSRLGACSPSSVIAQETDQQVTCIYDFRMSQNESTRALYTREIDNLPAPALPAIISSRSSEGPSQTTGSKFAPRPSADLRRQGDSSQTTDICPNRSTDHHISACLQKYNDTKKEVAPSETGSASVDDCRSLWDTPRTPGIFNIKETDHCTQKEVAALKESNTVEPTMNQQKVSANTGTKKEPSPVYPDYAEKTTRIATFKEWPPELQQPEEMADCGFYHTGFGDRVHCFHCGIVLHQWKSEDDPWIEHVRHSPECKYVRMMKGDKFVSQAKMAKEREEAERNSGGGNQAPENNKAAPEVPSKEGHQTTGNTQSEQSQKDPEKIREHREIHEANLCRICMENTISVVFLPCAHLVTCSDCAPAMRKCPICRTLIKGTVKIFNE